MKRKIVIGLAIYSVVCLLTGAYVLRTIRNATTSLDRLITLHQVEILRERYLLEIKRVQSDLMLKDTMHSRSYETFITDVMGMGGLIDNCFQCHHSPDVTDRLNGLKRETERYKDALSRVLTIRANAARLAAEKDNAFRIGEELIGQVREMISFTTTRLGENTQKALGEIERTNYFLYALVALGPLVSVLLGYLFIYVVTRHVKVLVESTRKLKGGDLDHRVAGLVDEFGEVAASFNEMAGSLKEQMQKMQRTEQMVVVGELAAGLAHEIKNPMAGIKVAMSVLSGEAYISDEDKAVLRKVIAEITQLEGLMRSFLDFAKPQKPRLEAVNVNQMLNTTLAFHLKHQAIGADGSGKIEIVKEFGELPPTLADPTQLQRIFLNLFLNALHAMPRGGELGIRTRLEEDGKTIRIEVSDTGVGIREDIINKIFQPFFTTKPKGTGLGLAISRQLIERHDGTIAVANRPGGGVRFTLRLPVKAEAGATA